MQRSASRAAFILLFIIASFNSAIKADTSETQENEKQKIDLVPKIHGVMRARWEMDTKGGENRFQIRNARVNLSGKVAPIIDYYIQTDLCDRGTMKILDAWGRIAISQSLKFQAGQFRLPFGTDCFRGPGNYIFANRSFIGGTMNNVRGVGAKLSYSIALRPTSNLTIEGGAFNPTAIADHNVWVKEIAFAGKAIYTIDDFKLAAGGETLIPDSIRINSFGLSASWTHGGWTIEGEYVNKHYTNKAHKAAHGYNIFIDYGFPVKSAIFNRASVQARFDGMTAHSNGKRDKETKTLLTNNDARNRATVGGTLSYIYKSVRCDIRLNYEKYFYRHSAPDIPGIGDKICAEMVIKF